jgi:hypothetical protein
LRLIETAAFFVGLFAVGSMLYLFATQLPAVRTETYQPARTSEPFTPFVPTPGGPKQ